MSTTTIEDVARRAGVSTATVSRALRGLPNVAPSTRDRVLRVAQEMAYALPGIGASSKTVGIISLMTDQWFFNRLGASVEAVLMSQGYNFLRQSVSDAAEQTSKIQHLVTQYRVDGLLIITVPLSEESLAFLSQAGRPVVTIETRAPDFPAVYCDNIAAARMATQHLLNLGHERIGVISGLPDDPVGFSVPNQRLRGYHLHLEAQGIEVRPELNVPGNFSYAGGAEATVRLLSVPHPPTAILAFSDEMAIGAIKTLRDMGLRVPQDISVIGFDDQDVAAYVGLTTVQQPVNDFGEEAVNLLLQQLQSPGSPVQSVQLPTRLVIRSTTGPLREKKRPSPG